MGASGAAPTDTGWSASGTPPTASPGPAAPSSLGGPFVPPVAGAAGATGPTGTSGVRHPEYLVDADPWRDPADDPDERRLVTPPVIGEQDDR